MNKIIKYVVKQKKLFVLFTVFGLWMLVIAFIIKDHEEKKESYMVNNLNMFESKVESTLKTYERFSEYIFKRIINRREILELLKSSKYGDAAEKDIVRAKLFSLLEPEYQLMKQYNFLQLHIHTVEGNSFLRMHMPDKYGDSLLDVRESIRIVNNEKKPVFGFEEGRIFNSYRFVYPLIYEEEYLGSVEVSISMASIINIIEEIYPDIKTTFIVDEQTVRNTVLPEQQENYPKHPDLSGFVLDYEVENNRNNTTAINQDIQSYILNEIKDKHLKSIENIESFSDVLSYKGKDYSVQFLGIDNIAQKPVAYLIGISENIEYNRLYNYQKGDLIILNIMFILLLIVIYVYMKKQSVLLKLSTTDSLTNLYNRHTFMNLSKKKLKNSKADSFLMILDIDRFKNINDRFGHNEGDRILKVISDTLREIVVEQGLVGRWGGDEFIILLPETDQQWSIKVAESIRENISNINDEVVGKITASFGVSKCNDFEFMTESIHQADKAMYNSKNNGGNKISLYNKTF